MTYCNGCARVHTMTSAPVAWTVTAFHNRGGRSATDYTTKKAALALFVEYVKAGITVELRSPAGHCHNAYRAETGDVLVEADGSYRLP